MSAVSALAEMRVLDQEFKLNLVHMSHSSDY